MISSKSLPNGQTYFEQKPLGPTVYLDQWMWCHLSEDHSLRNRFIQAGSSRQICIMYSIASLIELAQIQDIRQLDAIKEIMDSIDFGFVDIDPPRVISLERENESSVVGVFNNRHPAIDHELLEYVIKRHYPDIPKMSTILNDSKSESPIRYSSMAESLATSLNPIIDRARSNPAVLSRAKVMNKKRPCYRAGPPYTADILNTLEFYLVANETMRMNRNEWMDTFHLVVPISYLDYVLMDNRWAHFVHNHLKFSPPDIARVYGPNDIEQFIDDLSFH